MLVVGSSHRGGLLSGSSVPMYPALDKRLKALGRMGASIVLTPPRQLPLWMLLLFTAAGAVCAVLLSIAIYLLVMVSIGLSGLFTFMPAMILHAMLR